MALAPSSGVPRTTCVALRAGGFSWPVTFVRAAAPPTAGRVELEIGERLRHDLLRAGSHDSLERRVARLAEQLRAHDERRHRRLQHVEAGRADPTDAHGPAAAIGLDLRRGRQVRQPSSVATPAPTTPPTPSEVSKPARTRSYSSGPSAAASTATVDQPSDPASAGSVTSTPLWAPIARPLRIVSTPFGGAIESRVTSASWASASLSAASSMYSSLPLMTAGDAARSRRPSGPSRSRGRRDPARAWSGPRSEGARGEPPLAGSNGLSMIERVGEKRPSREVSPRASLSTSGSKRR